MCHPKSCPQTRSTQIPGYGPVNVPDFAAIAWTKQELSGAISSAYTAVLHGLATAETLRSCDHRSFKLTTQCACGTQMPQPANWIYINLYTFEGQTKEMNPSQQFHIQISHELHFYNFRILESEMDQNDKGFMVSGK